MDSIRMCDDEPGISQDEYRRLYAAYVASLPHFPIWNLIPRKSQAVPWECSWHGTIAEVRCAECRREHDAWRETGSWTPPGSG